MEQYKKECWIRRTIILTVILVQIVSVWIYLYDKVKNDVNFSFFGISFTVIVFVLMDYFFFYRNIKNISRRKLEERYEMAEYQQRMQKKYDRDMEKYTQESQEIRENLLMQIDAMRTNLESKNTERQKRVLLIFCWGIES